MTGLAAADGPRSLLRHAASHPKIRGYRLALVVVPDRHARQQPKVDGCRFDVRRRKTLAFAAGI
jgi:hypothetical protein